MLRSLARLRCPDCHAPDLLVEKSGASCAFCGTSFPQVGGKPVLIGSDNGLFPRARYVTRSVGAVAPKRRRLARIAPSRSVNLAYRRTLSAFTAGLGGVGTKSVLVVGAGSQKDWLEDFFASRADVEVTYCDVDINGNVDLFCDGHELPFVDETFDGAIACAVLEHVAHPERVVSEMHRVLKGWRARLTPRSPSFSGAGASSRGCIRLHEVYPLGTPPTPQPFPRDPKRCRRGTRDHACLGGRALRRLLRTAAVATSRSARVCSHGPVLA